METYIVQGLNCYKNIENNGDLSGFVTGYSGLIKKIVNHIKCKLPANIERDDLIQAGIIGLLEAKNKFSTESGASFETYATIKIRGAIIDELRKNTGITRDISQNIKTISLARSQIENTDKSNMLSSKAIADKMGITEKKYTHMMNEINAYHSMSMNDFEAIEEVPCTRSINPIDAIEYADTHDAVKALLKTLPKREQQILALYYNEQLNFKEIADMFDLTEARISQLHAISLAKIRKKYCYLALS